MNDVFIGDQKATFQQAREAAQKKLCEDIHIAERKMLFGVERTLTVKVIPDPHCEGCGGDGFQMSNGREITCYCIIWGEIVDEDKKGPGQG